MKRSAKAGPAPDGDWGERVVSLVPGGSVVRIGRTTSGQITFVVTVSDRDDAAALARARQMLGALEEAYPFVPKLVARGGGR